MGLGASDRKDEILRCAARLHRAAELESGSFVATQSAYWEVRAVRRNLAEIEASLKQRMDLINPAVKW